MCLQANFNAGAGGTSTTAIVQTSLDGQTTWVDVANFSFATTSGRQIYNLNSSTSVTTNYSPTDGTLAANTAKDGVSGNFWRLKLITVGTYSSGTTIGVNAIANGLTTWIAGGYT
jgi:hypothetical protein